jgi:hypothetical protein
LIDEKRTVSVEINDTAVDATFSFNLSGDGFAHINVSNESWFFRLEAKRVYVLYSINPLSHSVPHSCDPDVYIFHPWRYKSNGKSGGLGKCQEKIASTLWPELDRLMEQELRKRGWQWCGFNSRCNNNSMYRRPTNNNSQEGK